MTARRPGIRQALRQQPYQSRQKGVEQCALGLTCRPKEKLVFERNGPMRQYDLPLVLAAINSHEDGGGSPRRDLLGPPQHGVARPDLGERDHPPLNDEIEGDIRRELFLNATRHGFAGQ